MVYLASHGSRDHVLTVTMPPLEVAPLTAPALRGLLDASGIKWRIVVVSACYSGGFIDALKDDYTLVLTAVGHRPHVVRLRQRERQHVLRRGAVPAWACAVRLGARRIRRGESACRRARGGGRVQAAVESADLRRAGDGRQAQGARPGQRRAAYWPERLRQTGICYENGVCMAERIHWFDARRTHQLYLKILSRGGAVWQLVGLITRRSKVQILPPQPFPSSNLRRLPPAAGGAIQTRQRVLAPIPRGGSRRRSPEAWPGERVTS